MATKHVNADKGPSFQSSKGRREGEAPKASGSSSSTRGREKNVGHKSAEEHARIAKGNRG